MSCPARKAIQAIVVTCYNNSYGLDYIGDTNPKHLQLNTHSNCQASATVLICHEALRHTLQSHKLMIHFILSFQPLCLIISTRKCHFIVFLSIRH